MAYDAHTHLDFPAFDDDRETVCADARAAGVTGWLVAGADPDHWERAAAVAHQTGAQLALGVHPMFVRDDRLAADLDRLASLPMDAVGECGLDHPAAPTAAQRDAQRDAFRAQLRLARERDLPVVLHLVRATSEALLLMRADGLPAAGGMVHRWSGKPPQVEGALALGLHLSFGPELLNPKNTTLRESLRRVPLNRLLLETDCPELPVEGRARGRPSDVLRVADIAAQVRREPLESLLSATEANARALLRLPPSP